MRHLNIAVKTLYASRLAGTIAILPFVGDESKIHTYAWRTPAAICNCLMLHPLSHRRVFTSGQRIRRWSRLAGGQEARSDQLARIEVIGSTRDARLAGM